MQNLTLVEQMKVLNIPIGYIAKQSGYTYTYIHNIVNGRVKMTAGVEAVLREEIEGRKATLREFLKEN